MMRSGERFVTAMGNKVADRVPVAPDISNYIPAKRTGLPFWDVYYHREVPLWKAYIDAAEYYGIDMWLGSCVGPPLVYELNRVESSVTIRPDETRDAMTRQIVWRTPDGELEATDLCFRADPPTHRTRMIKDIATDWKAFRHLRQPAVAVDEDLAAQMRLEAHSRGAAYGVSIGYPGFQAWEGLVEGSVATLSYLFMDAPEILDEWFELDLAVGTRAVELFLSTNPDYVTFGGSGTITLASPELAMRYAIPALARWSRMTAEAGVPSVLHSCGKSRVLVDMLAEHTQIDCINPLEVPPMGDVDLAEVKAARGHDIALMGNLHTTELMLYGSPDDVYAASVQAIHDGGEGGGFILSTGDQCPRDTPDENLFAMVQAAKDHGCYERTTGALLRNSATGSFGLRE
jgi:uroporphyrinogen decarboxylase